MDRREAIKRTSLIMGGTIFAPSILGVLQGCTPQRAETDWTPELFSDSQARLVTALADTILPPDDYPGAAELGVPQFIDSMVNTVYTEEQQEYFLNGMDDFNELARTAYDSDFADLSDEQKYEFASEKNEESLDPDHVDIPDDAPFSDPFFLIFKELTLLGYFTSEVGATEVLQYQMNPGDFRGCEPLEEIGKTWAT